MRASRRFIQLLVLLPFTLLGLAPTLYAQSVLSRPPREPVEIARGKQGIVVSDTPFASDIGCKLLEDGGNAIDAAIGVAFALQVSWPEAGNIGGGGFMMIAPPERDVVCVDYREIAPRAVDQNSFADWKERHHIRMAGVPGTVRGLALAHEQYGKLPWKDLIAPSIALARDGIKVDAYLAYSLNTVLSDQGIQSKPRFQEFRRVYGHPQRRHWQPGDLLYQPDLAETLELIAEQGPSAFYEGPIAEKIVLASEQNEGLIDADDLKAYAAKVKPAIQGSFGPYTICGAPPASSGGITVLMQMQMLESFDFPTDSKNFWTTEQVHLLTEVMRRGFRERAAWLGDPDFVSIPKEIQANTYAQSLAQTIDLSRATPSAEIAGSIPLSEGPYESLETTHFSIIDKDGFAVSNTYTLEGTFGCRIVVPGTGFLLNNEMGDFNWYPGYTNREGTIGTPANQMAPGKRMLSSQSPTIVLRNGQPKLLIGSPGGRTIINTVTEILTQTLLMEHSLEEAIDGPRFHHQWFPDAIRFETSDKGLFVPIKEELKAMGHNIEDTTSWRQGSAHGIIVNLETGETKGVADWRRGGAARSVK